MDIVKELKMTALKNVYRYGKNILGTMFLLKGGKKTQGLKRSNHRLFAGGWVVSSETAP